MKMLYNGLPELGVIIKYLSYTPCQELMKSVGSHGSSALMLSTMEGDGLTFCEQLSQEATAGSYARRDRAISATLLSVKPYFLNTSK
jgi:hypothetical protein